MSTVHGARERDGVAGLVSTAVLAAPDLVNGSPIVAHRRLNITRLSAGIFEQLERERYWTGWSVSTAP